MRSPVYRAAGGTPAQPTQSPSLGGLLQVGVVVWGLCVDIPPVSEFLRHLPLHLTLWGAVCKPRPQSGVAGRGAQGQAHGGLVLRGSPTDTQQAGGYCGCRLGWG